MCVRAVWFLGTLPGLVADGSDSEFEQTGTEVPDQDTGSCLSPSVPTNHPGRTAERGGWGGRNMLASQLHPLTHPPHLSYTPSGLELLQELRGRRRRSEAFDMPGDPGEGLIDATAPIGGGEFISES